MKTFEPGGSILIANRQISSPMPVAWDPTASKWVKFDMKFVGGVPTWYPTEADPPQTYIMSDGTEWAPFINMVGGVPTWSFQQVT